MSYLGPLADFMVGVPADYSVWPSRFEWNFSRYSVPTYMTTEQNTDHVDIDVSCAELERMTLKYPSFSDREMVPTSGEYKPQESVALYRMAAMKDHKVNQNLPNKIYQTLAEWTPVVDQEYDKADTQLAKVREALKNSDRLELLPEPTAEDFVRGFLRQLCTDDPHVADRLLDLFPDIAKTIADRVETESKIYKNVKSAAGRFDNTIQRDYR